MQNAAICNPGTSGPRTVKNLGWLIRHASDVVALSILPPTEAGTACTLHATLEGGTAYLCPFQSVTVCRGWIKTRRNFEGVPVADFLLTN